MSTKNMNSTTMITTTTTTTTTITTTTTTTITTTITIRASKPKHNVQQQWLDPSQPRILGLR